MKCSVAALSIGLVMLLYGGARAEDSPKKTPPAKQAAAKPDANPEKPAEPKKDASSSKPLKEVLKDLAQVDGEIKATEQKLAELKEKRSESTANLLELAEKDPTDVGAVQVAMMMLENVEELEQEEQRRTLKLLELIAKHHAGKPEVGPLTKQLVKMQVDARQIRILLTKVAEENKDGVALSWALWGLVQRAEQEADDEEGAAKLEALLTRLIAAAPKSEKELPLEQAEQILLDLQRLGIGKTAPEAVSKNLEGKTEKLSDYKGKIVVLDFWATWCPHCTKMIPHERELVSNMKGKPFALISISADEDLETVVEFLKDKENAMPWHHWYAGTKGIVADWKVKSFPTIYVLDGKGVIRYRNVRGKELDKAVATLLKEVETKE